MTIGFRMRQAPGPWLWLRLLCSEVLSHAVVPQHAERMTAWAWGPVHRSSAFPHVEDTTPRDQPWRLAGPARAQQLVCLHRQSSAETRDAPGSLHTIVVFHLLLRKRLAVRTPWITVEKAMAYQAPLMPIPTIITRA
jgi:hypothetical protein